MLREVCRMDRPLKGTDIIFGIPTKDEWKWWRAWERAASSRRFKILLKVYVVAEGDHVTASLLFMFKERRLSFLFSVVK